MIKHILLKKASLETNSDVQVPAIKTQWFSFCPSDISKYEIDIAPARTFGIAEQVSRFRRI